VLAALRDGRLPAGSRVHETALARTLGVSLAPVRDALFRLVDQGVLDHRPRRGFFVCALGDAEIREIYTLRAVLEGFAARLIAEAYAAAPDQETRFAAAFEALESLVASAERAGYDGDTLAVRDLNARFHDEIFRLAGHIMLRRAWTSLTPASWLLTPGARLERMPPEAVQEWVVRHRRLLAVLRSGDPDEAEHEAATHVRGAGVERRRRLGERSTIPERSVP
jgi:DNA-binding GntR family transcriptional regulator